MADTKISALTDGGGLQADDDLPVNRGGSNFKTRGIGTDGWISDTAETWTYASGSGGGTATFTVPGDKRSKYTVGTRIKLTQTTVKYFVIVADPTYDGTNTTVTITAGSDYTLANATISSNYHSYAANPQGYPGWFNFAGAATGFSSITTAIYRFRVIGRECFIHVQVTGTSNATTLTWTMPVAAAQASFYPHLTQNSGTNANGRTATSAGSTTATVTNSIAAASFTASGTKQTFEDFAYEI